MKYCCKIIFIFLSMIFFIDIGDVFAQESEKGSLTCMDVYCSPGETVEVPVVITDNPGIMGFSIEIRYDKESILPVSIRKGDVLSTGTMYDNIGAETDDGILKVMWSATENVETDGELFLVSFQSISQSESLAELHLSYNQADTFNESWEELELGTQSGFVRVKATAEEQEYMQEESEQQNQNCMEVATLIRDQEMKENVFPSNDTGQMDTAEKKKWQSSDYKHIMNLVIEKALQEQGVADFDAVKNLDKEGKEQFVHRVAILLEENGMTVNDFGEKTTTNQKIEIIHLLWNDATGRESLEDAKKKSEGSINYQYTFGTIMKIVGGGIGIILLITIFLYRYRKRKRGIQHEGKK